MSAYALRLCYKKRAGFRTGRALQIVSPRGVFSYGVSLCAQDWRWVAWRVGAAFPVLCVLINGAALECGLDSLYLRAALVGIVSFAVLASGSSRFTRLSKGASDHLAVSREVMINRHQYRALKERFRRRGFYNLLLNNCFRQPRRVFEGVLGL